MFEPQLSTYATHGFIYLNDGSLYGFGNNSHGELGLGHQNEVKDMVYVMTDPNIKKIVCANKKSLILTRDGTLKLVGLYQKLIFKEFVELIDNVDDVYVCPGHIFVLISDKVYTFISDENIFRSIAHNIDKIFCSLNLFVLVRSTQLYKYMLDEKKLIFVQSVKNLKGVYEVGQHLIFWTGDKIITETQECLFQSSKIRHVVAGSEHLIILTTDGEIYGLGNNRYGGLCLTEQMKFSGGICLKSFRQTKEIKRELIEIPSTIMLDSCQLLLKDMTILNCTVTRDSTVILREQSDCDLEFVIVDNYGLLEVDIDLMRTLNIIMGLQGLQIDDLKNFDINSITDDSVNKCLLDFMMNFKLDIVELKVKQFPYFLEDSNLWIRILGSGTTKTFDPDEFRFYPQNLRRYILFILFCFKSTHHINIRLPKFIRIEILKFIFD